MREGIIGLLVSGVGFFVLFIVLIYGVVKTKKVAIVLGVLGLLAALAGGIWSAGRIIVESRRRVESITAPRTGEVVYVALFGEPEPCVQVLNHQDQTIPVIDYAIYLKVQTCPREMERLAQRRTYEVEKIAPPAAGNRMDNLAWFNPAVMGDSVWVWSRFDEFGNGQRIYLSPDSTLFFCEDIAD